jgi:hypothetical protein
MKFVNRRSLLAGTAASGVAAAGFWASLFQAEAAAGQPLRIPDLIDARSQRNASL